eukprot:NODE_24_length_36516_cov_0.652470.p14 type:complete len:222 gc:universal NODE_24_length_36516_cov_0.652470:14142-13477(-)
MLSLFARIAVSQAIYTKCVNKNMVALTLDDGPSGNTQSYLDLFKTQGIRVTFFVVGTQMEKFPGLVRKIYNAGHSVAGHTYTHHDLAKDLSDEQVYQEVKKANNLINKETGRWPSFMRPPYGSLDPAATKVITGPRLGMKIVLWDVDSNDWKVPETLTEAQSVQNMLDPLSQPNDGHIILTHEIHSVVLKNLKTVVTQYKAKGYKFVKLHECLGFKSDYKW